MRPFFAGRKRLGGWSRAYVVTAATYAVVIAVWCWSAMPTYEPLLNAAERTLPPRQLWQSFIDKGKDPLLASWKAADVYGNEEWFTHLRVETSVRRNKTYWDSVRDDDPTHGLWRAVRDSSELAHKASVRDQQLTYAYLGFGLWLIPLVVLYIGGRAAGWIADGFRNADA